MKISVTKTQALYYEAKMNITDDEQLIFDVKNKAKYQHDRSFQWLRRVNVVK